MLHEFLLLYNGTGLLLEIIGLLVLLRSGRILKSKPVSRFQSNEYFASPVRLELANSNLVNQNQSQTYSVGIYIIILGLFFQFIAMF